MMGYTDPSGEAVATLGVPVFFHTSARGPDCDSRTAIVQQREGYLNELGVLMRWMDRYPDVVCSFDSRVFLGASSLTTDRISLPRAILGTLRESQSQHGGVLPGAVGGTSSISRTGKFGTHLNQWSIVWARIICSGEQDMPFQNRFCTYRQSRDWIEKNCTFLSERDLAMIMGGTTRRAFLAYKSCQTWRSQRCLSPPVSETRVYSMLLETASFCRSDLQGRDVRSRQVRLETAPTG